MDKSQTLTSFDSTQDNIDRLKIDGYHDAATDLERWRNLAQHLCFAAGHGPKRHALDPNRCGRCERVLGA